MKATVFIKTFLSISGKKTVVYLLLGAYVFFALFFGLGDFGLWEPGETENAKIAFNIAEGSDTSKYPFYKNIEEHLVAWSIKTFSDDLYALKFPVVLMGLGVIILVFLFLHFVQDLKYAVLGILILVSSPIFIFHSRQLTSQMPGMLFEVMAVTGIITSVFIKSTAKRIAALLLGTVGIIGGVISGGLIIGLSVPALTGGLALYLARDKNKNQHDSLFVRVVIRTSILSGIAGAVIFTLFYFFNSGANLYLGGTIGELNPHFDFASILIIPAYGFFPWIIFAAVTYFSFLSDTKEDEKEKTLRLLAVLGITTGLIAHYICNLIQTGQFYTTVLPYVLAVVVALKDILKNKEPQRVLSFIALLLFIYFLRDFASEPDSILTSYGFSSLKIPKDFAPALYTGIFSAPALLIVVGPAMIKMRDELKIFLVYLFVLLTSLLFGGYLTFGLVPSLSKDLSSRHSFLAYEKFKKADEPLAVYGETSIKMPEAKKIHTMRALVKWLTNKKRNFAMFAPEKLSILNNEYRSETNDHIFILDAKSSRLMLATSKPLPSEKNMNPIAVHVKSKPFKDPKIKKVNINFQDTVILTGWKLESDTGRPYMEKGRDLVMSTYFRCSGKFKDKYQIFVHIDGPGGRIHGDHYPVEDIFSTLRWKVGDYISDIHKIKIPLYQKSGNYTVKMGFYKGGTRLKILNNTTSSETIFKVTDLLLK